MADLALALNVILRIVYDKEAGDPFLVEEHAALVESAPWMRELTSNLENSLVRLHTEFSEATTPA